MRQHQHQIGDVLFNIYQAMAYNVAQNSFKANGGKSPSIFGYSEISAIFLWVMIVLPSQQEETQR